jgi:hypothetical protein
VKFAVRVARHREERSALSAYVTPVVSPPGGRGRSPHLERVRGQNGERDVMNCPMLLNDMLVM